MQKNRESAGGAFDAPCEVVMFVPKHSAHPLVALVAAAAILVAPLPPIGRALLHAEGAEAILLVNAAIDRTVSPVDRIRVLSALERHLQEVRHLLVEQPVQGAKTTSLINQIYRAGSIEEALPTLKRLATVMGMEHALVVSIEPVREEMELKGFRLLSSYMEVASGQVTVNNPITFSLLLDDLSEKLATLPLPIGAPSKGEASDILSKEGDDIGCLAL